MKLSIITINRNNADGLHRTLESTFDAQPDFDDWEQIVVDGASTDGSFAVLDKWKDNPHLGWHVSEPDTGIYNAMNKGTAHAQGDYLLFLNSGDELLPNVLAEVFVAPCNADIVYGDIIRVRRGGDSARLSFPEVSELTPTWFLFGWLPHPASFISRTLLLKSGGYDETFRIVSDAKFFMQAACNPSIRFSHIPIPVSRFYVGGLSSNPIYAGIMRAEMEAIWSPVFGKAAANQAASLRFGQHVERNDVRRYISSDAAAMAQHDASFTRILRAMTRAAAFLWRFRVSRILLKGGLAVVRGLVSPFRHRAKTEKGITS